MQKPKRKLSLWGKQCKSQMIMKDLSMKELCKKAGFGEYYISGIINGRIIAPDETVRKISAALDVDPALYQS